MKKIITNSEKEMIANIFTKKYYEVAYFLGIPYTSFLILELFNKNGVSNILKTKYVTSEEIIASTGFSSTAKYALEWMLSFLSQSGLLKKTNVRGIPEYYYDGQENIDSRSFYKKIIEVDREVIPSCNLMEYVISEYDNFFKGIKKGIEILFANDKIYLWNDYFNNNNSGYRVYNSFGAFGVAKWISNKKNITILEVGGGTGSATSFLLEKLKETNKLSIVDEYIFSDISPIFLRMGNKVIMSIVPDDFQYSLKKLDFDKPIIEQGFKENEFDVVYGVNSLHVAKNLATSL
ncbi:MAG: class I SAM-dependent methyltransferase, partial [Candidatus Omnitrophica bacterium]|nr:class I SAM-dependent methyltransferase [Candidatus Omnitrophota bacterium]